MSTSIEVTESNSLLNDDKKKTMGGRALGDFLTTSFCFAGVRSSSMLGLFYASSTFNIDLGSASLSAYYWWFSLTCLLISAPMVEWMGSTKALVLSQTTMTLYLLSYMLGCVGSIKDSEDAEWTIVVLGSCIGGFSSGLGWTAQGVYFALSAKQHAEETGVDDSEANDLFAGYWACIYFGGQFALYIIASLLFEFTHFSYFYCYMALTIGAATATSITYFVVKAPDGEAAMMEGAKDRSVVERSFATIRLSFVNPTAVLLQPLNIAYGFALVFLQVVVAEKVVDDHLGTFAVGYMGALQSGTVMSLSVPFAWLATRQGKVSVLLLGTAASTIIAGTFLLWNTREAGHWHTVVPIFFLYGVSRTQWESTNKAIFADFFVGNDRPPAFASLNFVRSVSAAILSLVVSQENPVRVVSCAITLLVPVVLQVPGFLAAKNRLFGSDGIPESRG